MLKITIAGAAMANESQADPARELRSGHQSAGNGTIARSCNGDVREPDAREPAVSAPDAGAPDPRIPDEPAKNYDWKPGDYPPDPRAQTYLELKGLPGRGGRTRGYKVHVPVSFSASETATSSMPARQRGSSCRASTAERGAVKKPTKQLIRSCDR